MTNPKGEDFRKFRDIAPEGVDDETIISLIKKSGGSHSAITAAIENMWHDLSDGKAVGGLDEWNTTSKSKSKKDALAAEQALAADRGGRGGRAGGRGQGAGGRGAGDRGSGRGSGSSGAGRGPSVSRSTAPSSTGSQSTLRSSPSDQIAAVTPALVATPPPQAAPTSFVGSSGWGSGGTTLAEKLKLAEIQKLLPPPAPQTITASVAENEALVGVESALAAPVVESHGDRGSRRPRGRGSGHSAAAVAEVTAEFEAKANVVDAAVNENVEEMVEEVVQQSVIETIVVEEDPVEVPATVAVELPVPVIVSVAEPVVVEHLVEIKAVVVPVVEAAPVSAPKAFLNMGKWEAPLESSPFQFGSFGNYSSTVNEDSISLSTKNTWSTATESADISQQQAQSEVAAVWGPNGASISDPSSSSSSSSSGPSPMSSLFPGPKSLPSVSDASISGTSSSSQSQNGRYDQQKTVAPPGLESHHSLSKPMPRQDSRSAAPGHNQSRVKYDTNQQQQQQQQQQHVQQPQQQQYQQPQYQQQSSATPPGTSRGQPPAAASMMYSYSPGFDIQSQYQQPSYGQPAPVAATPSVGSSPATTVGAPSAQTQTQEVAPSTPHGLQYGPPPGMANHYVNPYYGAPYYGSQYFYGQPLVPNPYYAQGRGDYQTQGRYGSDPYVPGVQYPNMYQGGGFADPMGMQQHPSMVPQIHGQGQSGAAAAAAPTAGGQGKQQKGASSTTAAPQQQDPNQGYAYNPYNGEGQWGYQGWNAPMMAFPGGAPTGGLGPQGFAQQPPQQTAQGQRPSSTGYGGSTTQQQQGQQPFPRGAAANPAAPGGGSTGQHW